MSNPLSTTPSSALPWQPLYTVERFGKPETTVFGQLCVWTGDGDSAGSMTVGDCDASLWTGALMRPFQLMTTLPLLKTVFNWLRDEDLAVMMATHSGQPGHVSVLEEALNRFKLSDAVLLCPAVYPMDVERACELRRRSVAMSSLYHADSGVHMGMLLSMMAQKLKVEDYLNPEMTMYQETQLLLEALLAASLGVPMADDCGMVNWALSPRQVAKLYASLATPMKSGTLASSTRLKDLNGLDVVKPYWDDISHLMRFYPELLGGQRRLDTRILQGRLTRGKNRVVLAKESPNGWLAVGLEPTADYPEGVGIAIRLAHGHMPMQFEVVLTEILRHLGFGKLQVLQGHSALETTFHFDLGLGNKPAGIFGS